MSADQELLRLTPVFENVEDGWTQASLVEIPGVITAAPTRGEAREMLLDALREFLLSFGPERPSASTSLAAEAFTLTVTVGTAPAA